MFSNVYGYPEKFNSWVPASSINIDENKKNLLKKKWITLPGNAEDQTTEKDKINNSQTDYTIKLNKPLEFNIPI